MDYQSIRKDDPSVFNPPEPCFNEHERQLYIDIRTDEYLREPEAMLAELPDAGHSILMLLMRADTPVKLFAAQAELNDAVMDMATFYAKRDWERRL